MAETLVFVADLDTPRLDPDERHHLRRVLRVGAGSTVEAGDGMGRWRTCRVDDGEAGLVAEGDIVQESRESPAVTIAFAPTKGDRPEWAVQKLTELGVDRIVVFMAARSVVRWTGSRAEGARLRLGRVAREAAMQSRRRWLPEVVFCESFAAAVDTGGGAAGGVAGGGVALCDFGGGPPSLEYPCLMVGPEGGWEESEAATDLPRVSLGPRVLRAETAAVAAATLLGGLRAGLVAPGSGARLVPPRN